MDQAIRQRFGMAALGGAAGLSFYSLIEGIDTGILSGRLALVLFAFAASFFAGALALSGAMRIALAIALAACVAVPVALLLLWTSLRFADATGLFSEPVLVLTAVFLGAIPLPFVIAAQEGNWRDYPTLFTAAWTIVVRYAAAWLFVGVVWLVIMLSDAVFQTIGLDIIERLLAIDAAPWLITGTVLGLATAVVTELSDLIAPDLVLRLMRLLVPVVLAVLVVFIVALPFKGLSGLVRGFSTGGMLLILIGLCTTLISVVVDRTADEEAQSRILRQSARAMALLIWVPALLAAVAVWMRVAQYGWTPYRVTAAMIALLALGYGAGYGLGALRGSGWMARIRQANVALALAGLGLAALSLTPLINGQAISAQDQLARLRDGRMPVGSLDMGNMAELGIAGEAALAELQTLAKQPGQEPLAAQLTAEAAHNIDRNLPKDRKSMIAALAQAMPLRPITATGLRDQIFAAQDDYFLRQWLSACKNPLPSGAAGCVMVVADFLPSNAGDEAMVLTLSNMNPDNFAVIAGKVNRRIGGFQGDQDRFIEVDVAMIMAAQKGDRPVLTPVPVNALTLEGRSFLMLP